MNTRKYRVFVADYVSQGLNLEHCIADLKDVLKHLISDISDAVIKFC